MSSCGFAGLSVANPLQRGSLEIAPEFLRFWWAEDSELEEAEHMLMHETGTSKRRRTRSDPPHGRAADLFDGA